MQYQSITELLKRYAAVFRAAWTNRKAAEPVPRLPFEAQFLPAALELQETPVSAAPRVAMWLIVAFSGLALVWAIFGRIDVIATARGKVVPGDRVKVVQPSETAVVKKIHVKEGAKVRAGDPLVDLDATITGADLTRVSEELADSQVSAARARALLSAIDDGVDDPVFQISDSVGTARSQNARRLLRGEIEEFRTHLRRIDAEIAQREAELAAARENFTRLAKTAPVAARRAKDFETLIDKGYVSHQEFEEAQRIRIETQQELAAQSNRLAQIESSIDESRRQRDTLIAETRRKTLTDASEAEQQIAALSQERIKAEQRRRLTQLTAPVDGTVQQLVVNTVGGVVTAAQPLMIIVPSDEALEVEAFVENTDIGFVRAGQSAEVKIDSFPFTKYGTIDSEITLVSHDAIEDEKRGLIFSARMRLERAAIRVEESLINLSPGMAVTVEIKTGKRRVIEYFLGPFLQYVDESLRER